MWGNDGKVHYRLRFLCNIKPAKKQHRWPFYMGLEIFEDHQDLIFKIVEKPYDQWRQEKLSSSFTILMNNMYSFFRIRG